MIKLSASLLTVDIVYLKTITTSLGGSISIVPSVAFDKKETATRVVVPMSVARSFIVKTKHVTRYLKPVLTALVKYDGVVVAMERHPLGVMGTLEYEGFDGKPRQWLPKCKELLETHIKPLINRGDRQWYFDGRYAYSLPNDDINVSIHGGQYLTRDGRFRKVTATTVDLQEMSDEEKIAPSERSCLAFVTASGVAAVSPPIWKDLSAVGGSALGKATRAKNEEDDDESEDTDAAIDNVPDAARTFNFDRIDDTLAVNLNFALKAGQEIGSTFGYEHVEPLQLPRLMIELHTVNLPTVPVQIKSTYDVNIKFTHALAWLLGMSRKANTLDTYLMMRSLMKYLTKRGIFRKSTFEASYVFKADQTIADVPLLPLSQLLEDNTTQASLAVIIEQARMGIMARKRNNRDTHQVGGLLNEE